MRNSPAKYFLKDADLNNPTETLEKKGFQHGIHHLVRCPILLDVPAETLTCITSYLDPPSLLAVAQVSSYLNQHANDENTWRRAFICQFLGIGPQFDFNGDHTLLLRRYETSWRNEFIVRYRLRRRWERSRNGSTTHIPVNSTISGMHQMVSNNGLLTSSLEYGIVARSIPLTGKILSGYLDASGSATGLGIGNPNAEFTPNISACAIASDGGTAKLVWGSRVGDVLFMSVPKAMDTGTRRGSAEVRRCTVADEHEGAVVDAVWLTVQPGWVVTGGADGRLKIWDAKNATSVWSSEQVFYSVIPDSCIKVAGSATHGFVVGVFKSGHIRIWAGFDFTLSTLADNVSQIVVECPVRASAEGYDPSLNHDVTTLDHDESANHLSVLVGYENDCYFYRIQVDRSTLDVETLAFGEPYAGSISTIASFFRTDRTESSIIFAGDHLGCISLYDWDADPHNVNPRTNAIGSFKRFEAHKDGASITSIVWNGLVLVSGFVGGDVLVFDGMTLESLRSFESPHPRFPRHLVGGEIERERREREKVRAILLGPEKDVVFMAIGNKVVAWKAGPVPKYIRGGVRSRDGPGWNKGKRSGHNVKQFDYLTRDIIESQDITEDESTFSARAHRARGREHDQREGLVALGLSEVEAVEYVLMVSRDEANQLASSSHEVDEGVFEGDFEGDGREHRGGWGNTRVRTPPMMPTSTSFNNSGTSSPPIVSSPSGSSFSFSSGRSPGTARITRTPRFSPSSHSSGSSTKIQVSPPHRAEPLEAGVEGEVGEPTRLGLQDHYFPPIGSVRKNVDEGQNTPDVVDSSPNKKRSSGSSSSAWSTPLTKKLSLSPSNKRLQILPSSSSSSSRSFAPSTVLGLRQVSPTTSGSALLEGRVVAGVNNIEDDDDLRFALELSLAEAKSAKDGV